MLFTQKWCSNLDPANCKFISDTHNSLEHASVKDIESLEEHFTVVENALGKITTKLESLKDECFNEEHGLKVKISSLKNREKKEYENKYKIYKNHKEEAEDEKTLMISNAQRADLLAHQNTNALVYAAATALRKMPVMTRWVYAFLMTILVIFPIFLTSIVYAAPQLASMKIRNTNVGRLVFYSDAAGLTFLLYCLLCNSRFGNRNVSAKSLRSLGALLISLTTSLLIYECFFTTSWEIAELVITVVAVMPLSMMVGVMYAKSRLALSTKYGLYVVVGVITPLMYFLPIINTEMRPVQYMMLFAVPTVSSIIFITSIMEQKYKIDSLKVLSFMFLFLVFPLFVVIPINAPIGISINKLLQFQYLDGSFSFSQLAVPLSFIVSALATAACILFFVVKFVFGKHLLKYLSPKHLFKSLKEMFASIHLNYWFIHIVILVIEVAVLIFAYGASIPSRRNGMIVLAMTMPVLHAIGFVGRNAKFKFRYRILLFVFCLLPLVSGIIFIVLSRNGVGDYMSLGLGLVAVPPALTFFWILIWGGKDYLANRKFRNYELVVSRIAVLCCMMCLIPFGVGLLSFSSRLPWLTHAFVLHLH